MYVHRKNYVLYLLLTIAYTTNSATYNAEFSVGIFVNYIILSDNYFPLVV